jgi:lipopolysaccharide O-acetyltransferase
VYASFASENGWFLLLAKLCGGALRRLRDFFVSRRLRAPGLRLGRTPRLLGLAHCRIGTNFSAGNDLWLDAITSFAGDRFNPQLVIGDNCNLSDAVHIACIGSVSIGSGFLCGSRVIISDHAHGSYGAAAAGGDSDPTVPPNLRRLATRGTVEIGSNVWIGDGAAILAGARIGDGAVIGANSIVSGVIPPGTIAAGAPARVIRRWDSGARAWVKSTD